MMCGKRYSPALTLATAYRSLGEMVRSRQFADIEREAADICWEGGRIRSSNGVNGTSRLCVATSAQFRPLPAVRAS
jgi:hypothetical protein